MKGLKISLMWSRMLLVVFYFSLAVGSASQNLKLEKNEFITLYDIQARCPKQTEWMITKNDIGNNKREPSWKFKNDIPDKSAIGRHSDYNNSGYDRGHLCPAVDRSSSRKSMRETFTMSNIAPMVPSLNRGSWKITENFCREVARHDDSVHVLVLPIFLFRDTTFIGKNRLAVPHAFVKVAWLEKNDSVIGTWFYFNK